ncbi:collagen binding domain-containing protein, partial [Bacillus amyloliquefaciens]|uniref:collagen binding domain-containing protein n=1 Tax=Bacillus amyloliquefaciens TaxID=1390 RepID=UPI0037D539B9
MTNSIGKLYIADLAPGDYQVVETQAPRGYKLDQAAPIPFTILANQTQPVERTAPNDPYYGSVTIVKVDEYDNSITLSG